MIAQIVNGFWIIVSGILTIAALCAAAYGAWKAMALCEQEKAQRAEEEQKELAFAGISEWEMRQITGRLLRADKKRRLYHVG